MITLIKPAFCNEWLATGFIFPTLSRLWIGTSLTYESETVVQEEEGRLGLFISGQVYFHVLPNEMIPQDENAADC